MPGHFVRECEKKTKDKSREKEQGSQMQLMADATERKWMDLWPETIQINVESQLNIGDTNQMVAGIYMENNTKELNLQEVKIKEPDAFP